MGNPRRGRLRATVAALIALLLLLLLGAWLLEEPAPGPVRHPVRTPLPPPPARARDLPEFPPPAPPAPVAAPAPAPPPLPEPAEEESGPWSVTTLGPGDRPLPGVWIANPKDGRRTVTTDAEGLATLPWRPEEEAKGLSVRVGGAAPDETVVLKRRRTTLRYPDLLPLEVQFVDGANGAALRAKHVALLRDPAPSIPLVPGGHRWILAVAPFRRGGSAKVRLEVDPQEGAALERGNPIEVVGTVNPFAALLNVTVVLRAEARVRVRVEDGRGRGVKRIPVDRAFVGGRLFPLRGVVTGEDGEARVPGLPELGGEGLVLSASVQGRRSTSEPVRLPSDGSELLARIDLSRSKAAKGDDHGDGVDDRIEEAPIAWTSAPPAAPEGTATLAVEVRRRDGATAEGLRVVLSGRAGDSVLPWSREARTGPDGSATFERAAAGKVVASAPDAGSWFPPVEGVLAAGEATHLVLREAESLDTGVRVVDSQDRPVPCARLLVEVPGGAPYAHMLERTQFLEVLTDESGVATLRGLPRGNVVVRASSGGQEGSTVGVPGTWIVVTLRVRK